MKARLYRCNQLIRERAQTALRDQRGIQIAQGSGRGVARIRKQHVAGAQTLLVHLLERGARQVNLATDLDLPGHSLAAIRRLARQATEGSFDDYLRREWLAQDAAFGTHEARTRFHDIFRARQSDGSAEPRPAEPRPAEPRPTAEVQPWS